jgi:hypothetical protein
MDAFTSAAAISFPVYTQCELLAAIRFLNPKAKSSIYIHRKLYETNGMDCMPAKFSYMGKWCKEFSGSQESGFFSCMITHFVRDSKAFFDLFDWDVISHPLYSSDLTPSGYHNS